MKSCRIVILCLLLFSSWQLRGGTQKPFNVVLILADDMGHGFVSCLYTNSKIPTPRIDRLAAEGMTFTDAHSGSAVCSPTRYGLLTGRYAWRTHLRSGVLKAYDPPLIERDRLTLPAFLQKNGYKTACIGKWHLGWDWPQQGTNDPDFSQPIANGPVTRGFDYYFGTHVPNQPPYCFIENDRTVGLPTARKGEPTHSTAGAPGPMLPGWRTDEILPGITKRAVDYIGERARQKEPFFLYLPLTSPHEPIAPSEQFRGKSGLNPMADFIMETDYAVGEVLDALSKNKLTENTLVIFTADNGSNLLYGGRELQKMGHDPSAGFRGSKRSIYEGGHRVPFFVRWPGKIKEGSVSGEVICLTDIFPTLAALMDIQLPKEAAPDGYDISSALLGQKRSRPIREATVHQATSGQLAIRQGEWKLIVPLPSRAGEAKEFELYNLKNDLGETQNVASKNPEMVTRLASLLERYEREGRSRP